MNIEINISNEQEELLKKRITAMGFNLTPKRLSIAKHALLQAIVNKNISSVLTKDVVLNNSEMVEVLRSSMLVFL